MKSKKALIFDTGSIITLALNDLLYILKPLKKEFGGEFYIPEPVKRELIDKPIKTKRFMLEALIIKSLIREGILKVVSNKNLVKKTKEILDLANNIFITEGEWIRLLHEGEASCLALFDIIDAKKKAIIIDERNTRILCENPENLRKLFEKKLHKNVRAIDEKYYYFKRFKIIRSSELAFIAYKKGIIKLPAKSQSVIRAILYATKYKGCAISNKEIETAKKL